MFGPGLMMWLYVSFLVFFENHRVVEGKADNLAYQLPLISIALTLHVDLINVVYLMACAFIRSL